MAKDKYLYFYCLGKKRGNDCEQGYIDIVTIETAIEGLYQKIQLSEDSVKELTYSLGKELNDRESYNIRQKEFIAKKMARLNKEREKLMQAYYMEAIPIDFLKKEQARISDEISKLEAKEEQQSSHFNQIGSILNAAIKMASNCYIAYKKAGDKNKGLFNKVVFKKIIFKDGKLSGYEYSELFEALYSSGSDKKTLVAHTGFEPVLPP